MGSSIQQRLGVRIRELRQARGLSQEAFADSCDLDRTYISGIERGVRNPTITTLETLAKGLEITLSELLENL